MSSFDYSSSFNGILLLDQHQVIPGLMTLETETDLAGTLLWSQSLNPDPWEFLVLSCFVYVFNFILVLDFVIYQRSIGIYDNNNFNEIKITIITKATITTTKSGVHYPKRMEAYRPSRCSKRQNSKFCSLLKFLLGKIVTKQILKLLSLPAVVLTNNSHPFNLIN